MNPSKTDPIDYLTSVSYTSGIIALLSIRLSFYSWLVKLLLSPRRQIMMVYAAVR